MGNEELRFKIIGLLVEVEEAAKELYTIFAERLPEHRAFWEEMATEEQHHVALVRMLGASVASGEARYNSDKFYPEDIQATLEWMRKQIDNTKNKKTLTQKAALEASLAVEEMVSEKTYFEAFEGVTEGLKDFIAGIVNAQDNHRDKVKELYEGEG